MRRRALIVDDEPEARRRLQRLLADHKDGVEVVGEADDGVAAVECIRELRPDIVFLDIDMPELDGFGVLDAIPESDWPAVIFTTAYGHYAIRAFEVHALDYLLKPVTRERLSGCLQRLDSVQPAVHHEKLRDLKSELPQMERLLVRQGQKLIAIAVSEVIAFESEDRLVFARTARGRHVLNVTMKELERRLNPAAFCRVHKQAIVQLSFVRELHSLPGGHYLVRLSDGSELQIGRNYARDFRARFG